MDELDEIYSIGTLGAALAVVSIAASMTLFNGRHDILQSSSPAQAAKTSLCPHRTDHRLVATVSK